MTTPIKSVLMVCTGNICRSPTAHGVMQQLVNDFGLKLKVESCGTSAVHAGQLPDGRAMIHAAQRGYDLSHIRASQIVESDFVNYDLILCMDKNHAHTLRREYPKPNKKHVKLFTEIFDDARHNIDVPDPYYGETEDFEYALDLIEEGCKKWLNNIR